MNARHQGLVTGVNARRKVANAKVVSQYFLTLVNIFRCNMYGVRNCIKVS